MELLHLDIANMKSELDMIGKFLPEVFFQHGQDGDGIQVALLFPNLIQKLQLLSSQVSNKVRCWRLYLMFCWLKDNHRPTTFFCD